MYTFFNSQFFHFEFLHVIGTAPFEGCDIGECLEAGGSIRINDAESWFAPGTRGYAVLTFDGPGQGIFLRQQDQKMEFPAGAPAGTYMRHDWEAVISKALDRLFSYAAKSPQLHLDVEKVAVFGESMGAYFALRGSADPRIKACIAMDGFYDMWDIADSRIPPVFLKAWDTMGDGFFNRVVRSLAKVDFRTRFEFAHARFALGLPDFAQSTREFKKFTLRNQDGSEYLVQVKCPVFVTGAADWAYFPAQGNATKIHAVMEKLHPGKSKLWIAKGVGSGGLQAKVAAISVVHNKTFEWLDEVLARSK
ncbi:hypothetical protein QQS21_004224 [Conoideocrella luteorostrata]|uniref:AB hydrolase-1 domain-containing protein n=1 Tax=Conoideocrella luteorostrata TaxID=1105319 RepID=A0AAJ0G1S4_9HYPO|nr:hypothetical protein QQS21_004224 [Conoideocrella luteorostrata]